MAVLEIFISSFEGYIYLSFFIRIFTRRTRLSSLIAMDIVFALAMYYLRLSNALPIIFVSATFVGMILMTLLFKTNWMESLAYSSLLTVFGFVAEITGGYLIIACTGVTYETIADDKRLFTIGVILSKLIHFIIVRITLRVVKRNADPTPLKHWAGSLVIPVVSIAVMHGFAVISDCFLQKDITVILLSIGGILFLNMTWFTVYDCMVAHTGKELSMQKEVGLRLSEKSKFTAMMQYSREMAAHVHDFKHHIGVLRLLMKTGEYKTNEVRLGQPIM